MDPKKPEPADGPTSKPKVDPFAFDLQSLDELKQSSIVLDMTPAQAPEAVPVAMPIEEPQVAKPAPPPAAKPATKPPPFPWNAPPIGPVLPEWKVLEPADQSDAVKHELHELRPRDATWNILAASLRGRLHAHKAMWREDAYAFNWVHDWTVIALSDGAGSARLARIGAQIACSEAVRSVIPALAALRMTVGAEETPSVDDQRQLREVLAKGAHDARAAVMLEAQKRQCPVRDMNATFLLLIHTPFKGATLVGALQVGDGAIGIYTEDDTCHVLGSADHGAYSSETRFLTDAGIDQQFGQRVQFSFFKKRLRGLAVMCDGVSDDFFPESKRLLELFNGNPIQELKKKNGESVYGVMHKDKGIVKNPEDGKALLDWLRYEKRGSSDDRTLVLMYRT